MLTRRWRSGLWSAPRQFGAISLWRPTTVSRNAVKARPETWFVCDRGWFARSVLRAPSPGGTTSERSRETMIRGLHCSLFAMLSVIAVIHADRRRSCLRAVVPVFALFEYQLDGGMLGCPCRLLVGIVARAIWARGITRHLSGGGESSPLRGLLGDAVKTIEVEDAPRLTIEGSAGVGPSCAFLHERRDLRGSRSNTTTGQDRSGVGTPGRVGRPRNLFPSCPNK